MTTPTPTGRVRTTDIGDREIVYIRTFRAPIEDVWSSITEPERTARWFAAWSGDAHPGATIDIQLVAEEGEPTGTLTIERCEPPTRLHVSLVDDAGRWDIEASLRETDGVTELEFVHRSTSDASVGETGPGWEYYLDRLVAARDGTPMPEFDEYYPAQRAYFEAQQSGGAPSG